MITVRRWYAYLSPWAMYRDTEVETLAEAHTIAKRVAEWCERQNTPYRVEVLSPTARVIYASDNEE